jgi:mono/diheme cytochrome c family protein
VKSNIHRRGRASFLLLAAGTIAALLGLSGIGLGAELPAPAPDTHFANADDHALVAEGWHVYAYHCGTCHGRRGEGQALWQLRDENAGRRAPAQDATGHTWQHSDEDIFHIVKFGRFAATPVDVASYMPAFEGTLSDRDILAVIAFIKAGWPLGLRASQSMLNPGFEGMPANADKVHWSLPPNCTGTIVNWQKTSR